MRTIESIHRDHTRRSEPDGERILPPADDCRACDYQRSVCRTKREFGSWDEAHDETFAKNIETGWGLMLAPYQCAWCGQWHITRARRIYRKSSRWRRVEKERRRWLTQQEVERRERQG